MDEGAIKRAMERLASAERGETDAAVEATLARARLQIEALAQATAELEETLPQRFGEAIRDGVREEALPVARNVAEVRGLMNAVLRRLERIEGDLLAERHARVDDLGILVDLITSGWRSVDERLGRMEKSLTAPTEAVLYRVEERRPPLDGSVEAPLAAPPLAP